MSDNIPLEIQVEIIKRFPVKSLVQFRSVCKPWKSLIDSSRFIAGYSGQQQHVFVRYYDISVGFEENDVSVVDDLQQKVSLTIPQLVRMLKEPRVVGSSQGLLCLYGYNCDCPLFLDKKIKAVIWNPCIRKVVAIDVPNVADGSNLGFGVCRATNDPKIVKITSRTFVSWVRLPHHIPWQVEVFALSSGAWRPPYMTNLPRVSVHFHRHNKVDIDGVFYWLAFDMDGGLQSYSHLIVSFDMTSEEFRQVSLPQSLANTGHDLCMYNLRDSLAVLEREVDANNQAFTVWMMEDGVLKSFTKLFNFMTPRLANVKGFWKSGEPIIEILEQGHGCGLHAVGSDGTRCSFRVYPYMESLLLFDQPDLMVYNGI